MIYFIGNKQEKFVKIGYTETQIKQRLLNMASNCPFELEVLLLLNGMKNTEEHIHNLLKSSHFRGEWYRITDEMQRFIDNPVVPYIEEKFRPIYKIREENDTTLIEMYKEGHSMLKISQATGFTLSQVRTYVKRKKLNILYKDVRSKAGGDSKHERTPRKYKIPDITPLQMI